MPGTEVLVRWSLALGGIIVSLVKKMPLNVTICIFIQNAYVIFRSILDSMIPYDS